MSFLVAIDPSVRSIGLALFYGDKLVACERVVVPPIGGEQDGARWLRAARTVVDVILTERHLRVGVLVIPLAIDTVVYERPQIYTASKSKGDPNDLIGCAGVGASIAALLQPQTVLTPTPAQWTGQIKKATKGSAKKSPRAQRILARLVPVELALVPDQHDVIDAVGLGLYARKRLEILRSYTSS